MNEEMNEQNEIAENTSEQGIEEQPPQAPPRTSGLALGLIMAFLMALSLGLGVAAGPMIMDWLAGVQMSSNGSMDMGHQHGAPAATADASMDDHSDQGGAMGTSDGWYVCPMHPWVVQPEPGTCPICTMDLTPLDPERFSGEIVIDPVVLQNIGVRVKPVVSGVVRMDIRTVGTIAYDERRIVDVNLKVGGWVEKMYVDFEGAQVSKGQKLLELYAPELYSTQEEYLLLWRNREVPGNDELLAAARRRLELFDVTDEQIEELQRTGEVSRTLTIYAPASGHVIAKNINEGQKVMPGNILFRIADLSSVWLMAMVYEQQLPFINIGHPVEATLEYLPGQRFTGRIDYVYPTVDSMTREVKVRMQVRNRNGVLKPGMFADVRIGKESSTDQSFQTLAPQEAVIDTGERQVAFVSLGDGRFEPRTVEKGRDAEGGMVEIINGLQPGEQVVVSGQFLLDSESRIRESLAKMIKGDLASDQMPELEMAASTGMMQMGEESQRRLGAVLEAYLTLQEMLYANQTGNIAAPAATLRNELQALGETPVPGNEHFWHNNENYMAAVQYAVTLADTRELEPARVAFSHVGNDLNELFSITGLPASHAEKVMGLRCGMYAPGPRKGVWLQRIGDAHNPFFGSGSGMASCSSEKWALPVNGEMPAMKSDEMADTVVSQEMQPQPQSHGDMHAMTGDTEMGISESRFTRMMDAYLAIHMALFSEKTDAIDRQAAAMLSALEGVEFPNGAELRSALKELRSAADIHAARVAFGRAGAALAGALEVVKVPEGYSTKLMVKHCGMFTDAPDGGIWLQTADGTKNPFFGQNHVMAACAPEEWNPGERKQK